MSLRSDYSMEASKSTFKNSFEWNGKGFVSHSPWVWPAIIGSYWAGKGARHWLKPRVSAPVLFFGTVAAVLVPLAWAASTFERVLVPEQKQ